MDNKTNKIVWMTLLVLGCVDLVRGFMHTVMLEYAAANIAGVSGGDALFLLRAFGISNYLTGALFILIALKARACPLCAGPHPCELCFWATGLAARSAGRAV